MIIRFFYNLLLVLVSPILLFSLYKKKQGKPVFGSRWKEHFGFTQPLQAVEQPLWIHAVSVGEVIAATPLIKALKVKYPTTPILVTTTTSTGAAQVEKLGSVVEHRYMPIDFSWAVRRFMKTVRPQKMLIMETELWPNTLNTVDSLNIPIIVINARLSEKSFRNYQRIQPLFNLLAPNLAHVCCQYQDDANRFEQLGISKDKLSITGSLKFDIQVPNDSTTAAKELRENLGHQRPVWIAASTHKGEDELVLEAHKIILEKLPNALLILVPRHPERFNAVFDLCLQSGFNVIRRTDNCNSFSDYQIYLADTMGEMLTLLGASDVCFMGGSLAGKKVGGHNVLEPIALGVPTITGPSYFNFSDIVESFHRNDAIFIIKNNDDLVSELSHLLLHPDKLKKQSSHTLNTYMKVASSALDKSLMIIDETKI